MRHLAVGGGIDELKIGLKAADAQQSVVVWWLFPDRDTEPLVVGVEPRFTSLIRTTLRAIVHVNGVSLCSFQPVLNMRP